MWGVFAKIFNKNNNNGSEQGGEEAPQTIGSSDMDSQDSYDAKQAKQRASVKWLLSKAFNNKVPENLKEPFYRDHENQEHLKPQIVGALANAEIYCLALGNIYTDPNYHNLNHWSILQTLSRKGVFIAEPNDSQLTETTLIQTNPLRMNAHMAVLESIMVLYAKEVVTTDRVLAAVQRFSHDSSHIAHLPENHEQGLLFWVNHTTEALAKRMEQYEDSEPKLSNGGGEKGRKVEVPKVKDLKDLCDGVALAALVCYYCPDELLASEIRISYLPTVQDSLHNLRLVQDFCSRCLPTSVFHMQPEDVTYMRGAMKQNLIVFLADLFNLLEIHPVKCVRYPGMERVPAEGYPARNAHGVAHKRNLPPMVMTPIPDLRSGLDDPIGSQAFQVPRNLPHQGLRKANSLQQSVSDMSVDSLRRGSEESFVVHKVKNIPTLSSVIQDEPMAPVRLRMSKERQNNDSKADERGDNIPAGRPSNWNENRKTYAGRRSRRNSISDDSQLTIENFGGSQDNLNFIGRNPDKEVGVHVGRKISAPAGPIDNPAVRSSLQDARGSIQLGFDNGYEKHESELENHNKFRRQLSSDEITLRSIKMHERNKENILQDLVDGDVHKSVIGGNTEAMVYMQHNNGSPPKSSFYNRSNSNGNSEKKTTTFATLPNTTTWQQQSSNSSQHHSDASSDDGIKGDHSVTTQLNDIRMKLEEKRRHIENEKRKMELMANKQREKFGKAAFLQAVGKGKGGLIKSSSDIMVDSLMSGSVEPASSSQSTSVTTGADVKPARPLTLKEITDDVSNVERKWMDPNQPFMETRRTPDIENMDLETYQQSISHMNSSLHDIQADIQKLASQQNQIQIAQQQQLLAHQKHLLQQQQQQPPDYHTAVPYTSFSQQPQFVSPNMYNTLQTSASAPHIPPHTMYQPALMTAPQQEFFLHTQQANPTIASPPPPAVPQRRTWAQQAQMPLQLGSDSSPYSQPSPELRTWGNKTQNTSGFLLHDSSGDRYDRFQDNRYHNGGGGDSSINHSSGGGFTLGQQHQLLSGSHSSSPSTSPQHRQHRQISQMMDTKRSGPVSLHNVIDPHPVRPERERKSSMAMHAAVPAPPIDDMEPQSVSFIGTAEEQVNESLSKLNITSGSRTYRIPSPTRPLITRNSFHPAANETSSKVESSAASSDADAGKKGFYISFDNEQPKRPKPPLRTKKGNSPKKERSYIEDDESEKERRQNLEKAERRQHLEKELQEEKARKEAEERRKAELQRHSQRENTSQEREKVNTAQAIIIGSDLKNLDPDEVDERERKKERILMMSLQRRQQQEEAKAKKEAELASRREKEKAKEEEKQRKKEEQIQRREAILAQHKMKKAMEEAEREGKDVDKSLLNSLKAAPKLRGKGTAPRPRPKTIHIDSGSVQMAEGMLPSARGKKGSSTNLTANSYSSSSSMKRDYYRGSQDSLASSGLMYKDSPDDSRGMSPCHSANQTLGRRSSYKTSRGSSTDQDSYAYRYGDTDSGLGRATPPRRAASPGMGPMRHLPSPSGPGSLPGLMSRRHQVFDDGSSDLSSTSSMMDYRGPRLYKQPSTKSNRSIMLNAVEYCVFPGAVNREAKQRVLEEIARSESKHFLILFRDAGCQFRALYSYCPEGEEVIKLYGTGPKQVNDRMFDKFFKYNSGGKCFAQVHTKHLTVTIDAFTIHNSLWQGKKVNLPSKKDMTLII